MSERRPRRIKETLAVVGSEAKLCARDQVAAITATVLGGVGTNDLANGNTTMGVIELGLAGTALAMNQVRSRVVERAALHSGIHAGAEAAMTAQSVMGEMFQGGVAVVFDARQDQEQREGPLYQSLDGEITIDSPGQLIRALGSPETAATRVGKIVADAKSEAEKNAGDLSSEGLASEQVEFLRVANVAVDIWGEGEQAFCDTGQDIIGDMRRIITHAEAKYADEHPTVIDVQPEESTK